MTITIGMLHVDMRANLLGDRGEFEAVHEIVELLSPYQNNRLLSYDE